MPTLLKSIVAWVPMVPIAIANAVLREALFARVADESAARALSTLTLLVLLGFYIAWVTRRWPATSLAQTVVTGAVWLALTVGFEFVLGAATGVPIEAMAQEYDITSGRLWSLVPLTVAIAPSLFLIVRGGRGKQARPADGAG